MADVSNVGIVQSLRPGVLSAVNGLDLRCSVACTTHGSAHGTQTHTVPSCVGNVAAEEEEEAEEETVAVMCGG